MLERGGADQTEARVDEGKLQPAADACCYRYAALIETAWLGQEDFGDMVQRTPSSVDWVGSHDRPAGGTQIST